MPSSSTTCGTGTTLIGDECVPDGTVICETGTMFDEATGTCVADITGCAPGTVQVGDECVPEDETLVADVQEPAEPNGFEEDAIWGAFDLPAVGSQVTLGGCITPHRDENGDGNLDPDYDVFAFEADGPAVLDITVAGLRGASGAFQLLSLDDRLFADGWVRIGMDQTNATSRRQVFLPTAGYYALAITDSRSILTQEGAGDDDTCYYATVQNVAIPAATAITDGAAGTFGDVALYSYDAAEGALLSSTLVDGSFAALGGLVYMVNDEYAGATEADFGGFGSPVSRAIGSLTASDELIIVVDPVVDYALTEVPYELSLYAPEVHADPGDGSGVTYTQPAHTASRYLYFHADAGDVVHLAAPGLNQDTLLWVYPPSVSQLGPAGSLDLLCAFCPDADDWLVAQESGYYYVEVVDFGTVVGDDNTVSFTRTAVTPTAATVGTTATGDLLSAEAAFFTIDISGERWLDFLVTPTGGDLATAELTAVPATNHGLFFNMADINSKDDGFFGQVVAGDSRTYLVMVMNADDHAGDETFDLDVQAKDGFEDLGDMAMGDSIDLTAETLAVNERAYYLVDLPAGAWVTVSATGEGSADLVLRPLFPNELPIFTVDQTFAGGTETFSFLAAVDFTLPLEIYEYDGAAATFDLEITAVETKTVTMSSSPDLTVPDDDANGVTDTIEISEDCDEIVAAPEIGVVIRHNYRGDLAISVTSAEGTEVALKTHDGGDSGVDVATTFTAGALMGEDGSGTWTLSVSDMLPSLEGVLESWSVTLTCI